MNKEKSFIPLFILAIFLTRVLFSQVPSPLGERLQKTEELRRQIRVINLVNGLELTSEEMAAVLDKAKEAQRANEAFRDQILASKEEMDGLLEEIKSYLEKNQEVPLLLAQRFHELNNEVKKAEIKREEKMKELSQDVRGVLREHQLYSLEKYVPCIIPPKGESRIGQAQDFKGVAKNLERIRNLPPYLYEQKKEEISRRTLDALKLHSPRAVELNGEQLGRHVMAIFEKARTLDEAEFEIQKEGLAKQLIEPLQPRVSDNINRKIESFLLVPEIIPVLEKRMTTPPFHR